jgi:hypothetical protein
LEIHWLNFFFFSSFHKDIAQWRLSANSLLRLLGMTYSLFPSLLVLFKTHISLPHSPPSALLVLLSFLASNWPCANPNDMKNGQILISVALILSEVTKG